MKIMEQFKVTEEGAEAALSELKMRVENTPELDFCRELTKMRSDACTFLVGGIVRDSVMGRESKDFDLLVEGVDKDDLEKFLKTLGRVKEVGRNFGVFKFVPAGFTNTIDIAVPRRDIHEVLGKASDTKVETENIKIEDDLSRRDFTINAIGFNINSGEVIDPFEGIKDIESETVRAVLEPEKRFMEDPGRILRGVRFAAKYNFDIESKTLKAMTELKDEIDRVVPGKFDKNGQPLSRISFETIGTEITKTLSANPEKFIYWYEKTGLLQKFFPEVVALRNIDQSLHYHSEGNAYEHTKLVLKNLPQEANLNLKMAALLHDVGKADTFNKDENGKIIFHGHDKASALAARQILNRLCFTNADKDAVLWLIENHMTVLINFPKRSGKQRALIKNPCFADLISLATADAESSLRPDGSTDLSFLEAIKLAVSRLAKDEAEKGESLGLNGHEIIEEIKKQKPDFEPKEEGKVIGRIKADLEAKFYEGKLTDKTVALKYLENNLDSYLH